MRLNWRTKYALSVRITGNVCAYPVGFVVGKGTNPNGIGGHVGVRLVVLIRPVVSLLASRFLLVSFKTNKSCIGKSLIILIKS